MSRETKVAQIPEIREDNVVEVLRAIKNVLSVREGHIGDSLDQYATFRDLVDFDLMKVGGSSTLTNGTTVTLIPSSKWPDNYDPYTDYTTPPAPTGLTAVGGSANVYLQWDGAPFKNPAYAEIWRGSVNNLSLAILVGTTAANVYADPASENQTYYYWIRFVSQANITGPFNSTNGTPATTAINVSAVLTALTGQITESQLYTSLASRINLIDGSSSLPNSVSARLLNLETTKIGYATLNSTGAVFDNAGTITNQAGVNSWNSANPSNQATWHTGLPFATAVKQVTVSDGVSSLTLEQRFTAQKSTNDSLYGQYTVKIDNNGHVSGFGLASGAVNGTPTSAFIVRADRFALAGPNDTTDPLGTINPTKLPFIVTTSPTTINGKTYPAGTWIDTAFIANATITDGHITTLTSDKITTGNLTAAIGVTTGRISGGVNTSYAFGSANFGTGFFLGLDSSVYKFRVGSYAKNMTWDGTDLSVTGNIQATTATFRGLTITDASGNIILSSGGVPSSVVSGLGALATQNSVSAAQVSGLGTLATQNSVSSGQVSGLGTLATANDVFIGSNVKIFNGSSYQTLNTGDFVNSLAKISQGTISTFIETGAIGNAYIGNLDAAKITSGTISSNVLDSTIITGKVANLTSAQIGDAQITTLKLGGEAVTVPRFAEQVSTGVNLTTSWSSDVCSVSYTVSGLGSGEQARVVVIAVMQAYPTNNTLTDLILGIFADGTLNTSVASTFGENGLSMANVGSWFVGNGTYTASVKVACFATGIGSSSKSNNSLVTRLIVLTAKR